MSSIGSLRDAELLVENVGGIEETTVTLSPGQTVLSGRNASNRTSLLQAIAAALGSDEASLKSDAESGRVELTVGDETYTRTLERGDRGTVTSGDPMLDEAEVADLFAFLFSWNEARRAATSGADLREVIMRPIDTDRIDAEIDRLESEKARIDDELEELDDVATELESLQNERAQVADELEAKRDELEAVRGDIADGDGDGPGREELDDRLDELEGLRSELESARYRLESQKQSLDSLGDERDELAAKRSELRDVPEDRIDDIDAEIERLRDRKQSIESRITRLDGIVEFNEDVLSGDAVALDDDGTLTDGLLGGDRMVTCWTCGSDVRRSAIEETLDRLRELRREERSDRSDVVERLESLKSEREGLVASRSERERIEERIDRVEDEITDRKGTVETLRGRVEDLESEVEDLESTVERLRSIDDDVLGGQRRASELEFEVDRIESRLDSIDENLDRLQSRLDERPVLERRRAEVSEELTEQRTKIERIESDAVSSFNEHMSGLLDVLEYDNLERIWIERTETDRREGRRTVTRPEFELHVVRSSEDDVVYEDTIDNLSESEREVVGLVFALSGYLAHDVHDDVPFMLLDSLEAIDSDRIASVLSYFQEYADFLVVALLPEDAEAVEPDDRITTI